LEPVELIPRRTFFDNPDRAMPRLSPDGRYMAYLAPADGVLNVWVGPADDPDAARPVTEDRGRGIRDFFWAYDARHVVYVQDTGGDENWHVHLTDVESGETRDVSPLDGVAARIFHVSHRHPERILIGLNDRNPHYHAPYVLDLATGERTLVEENERFIVYVSDEDLNLRLGVEPTAEGGAVYHRRNAEGEWEPFGTTHPDDALTTGPVEFDAVARVLYMVDSRDRDTAAWTETDWESGATRVLAEDPRADVSDYLSHPTTGRVEAVAFDYERRHWIVLDDAVRDDLDFLAGVCDGEVDVVSRTLADDRWIVAYVMDDGPVRYFLYERDAREARYLFSTRKKIEDLPLAKMQAHVLRSRDGLDLVSYLSLPPWADADGDGRPDAPLPMVLMVHGGPWARDAWGYNPHHQWLANRGYAVLSVNFRGSTGFGKTFINAGDGEWAARMHDDLLDGVEWAISEGITERDRVAIMGGSYGGYATLVGLTFTPDVFACGVDIVGPSSLITLLQSFPPYWSPIKGQFFRRVGDPATEEGRAYLLSRSPISRVEQIERPLLIAQGANDPRVTQVESDQIVDAMHEKGIPVTYVLYPDEGHGFARPENRFSFYAAVEGFLARHLGGRLEPVGDAFEDSSITVPAGADEVPGLTEALGVVGD
jgi:dipeptidyl aminopeptidase/acylaminoacyl peptidase